MMALPNEPCFVSAPKGENGGIDYLGLREANFQLMAEFLPGISNRTRLVRPYSLMCWTVRAFLHAKRDAGETAVWTHDFDAFREKVEILFAWSHKLAGEDLGLVGNSQVCPTQADESVPLNFKEWRRNVSWLDPGNYGPSLKDEFGLGFLSVHSRGLYALHPAGEGLGKGLDEQLRACGDAYDEVAATDALSGSESLAVQLHAGWRYLELSEEEASVFRAVFYVPDAIREARGKPLRSAAARRSIAVELIQVCLRSSDVALTCDEIRQKVARMVLPEDAITTDRGALLRAQTLWRILQLRQAQRLAFETLFGWCEHRIRMLEARGSEHLVDGLLASIEDTEGVPPGNDWVRERLAHYEAVDVGAGRCGIPGFASEQPGKDLFVRMAELQDAIWNGKDSAPAIALNLLLLVVAGVDGLAQGHPGAEYLGVGGNGRLSLREWSGHVRRRLGGSSRTLFHDIVETFVLSQHFGVAAMRTGANKPRLRIALEEGGLVSLLPDADQWHPIVTEDRLDAALSLMADCGLLENSIDESGWPVRYACPQASA